MSAYGDFINIYYDILDNKNNLINFKSKINLLISFICILFDLNLDHSNLDRSFFLIF